MIKYKPLQTIFLVCILIFNGLFFQKLHAATTKNLWPLWIINTPISTKKISHDKWQSFLNKNVYTNKDGINFVDYKRVSTEDRKLLEQYLAEMAAVEIASYNRHQQLAYWLNLYNALTVKLISDYYPVKSIREIKISPGLFSVGPWGAGLIKVNQTSLTLDDIHNRIIRPIWNDPRTHYAINNATIGAANLSKEAFNGDKIEEQLNQAASTYINSLRAVQIIEGKLIVSKVYDWYALDFGQEQTDIILHIHQFAAPELQNQLKMVNKIEAYVYNWHLNGPITNKE